MLGPVLGIDFSASIDIVKRLIDGLLSGLPHFGWPLADVRDNGDLHVRRYARRRPPASASSELAHFTGWSARRRDGTTHHVRTDRDARDGTAPPRSPSCARWSRRGIRISMDDYGSGYSSLAYLKMPPATELKIDRAFVTTLDIDARDALLVKSTVDLATASA